MSNLITKTTELAMSLTLSYISSGDAVIDATCGAGQDTVVLAAAVGAEGHVYAFDIQQKALLLTEAHLKAHGHENATLLQKSFATMNEYVTDGSVAAVVFNLGYLPGGDHSITTTADETIKGLECALKAIKANGIITVVLYDGHEEGVVEKKKVIEWAETLDSSKYHAAYVSLPNQKNHPPEILWITKKIDKTVSGLTHSVETVLDQADYLAEHDSKRMTHDEVFDGIRYNFRMPEELEQKN